MVLIQILLLACSSIGSTVAIESIITFKMPGIIPKPDDVNLCAAIRMPEGLSFATHFEPIARRDTVHHIDAYACREPAIRDDGNKYPYWDCSKPGQQVSSFPQPVVPDERICKQEPEAHSFKLWAYGLHTPATKLPAGVGFKFGGSNGLKYLVIQIHYWNTTSYNEDAKDFSGLETTIVQPDSLSSSQPMILPAGLLTLTSWATTPPHTIGHWDGVCVIDEDNIVMHPFYVLGHAHKHGTIASLWKVDGTTKQWTLISRNDIRAMQEWQPVTDQSIRIRSGDMLASRCVQNNTKSIPLVGGQNEEEGMCLVSVIYFVEGQDVLKKMDCVTNGNPEYDWNQDPILSPVPEWVEQAADSFSST